MPGEVSQSMKCQNCGEPLKESVDLPPEGRTPCPKCASIARHFEVMVSETMTMHEQIGMKARHGASGKPFLESTSRPRLSQEKAVAVGASKHNKALQLTAR